MLRSATLYVYRSVIKVKADGVLGDWRAPGNCWQLLKEQLRNIHNPVLMLDTENIVNGKTS